MKNTLAILSACLLAGITAVNAQDSTNPPAVPQGTVPQRTNVLQNIEDAGKAWYAVNPDVLTATNWTVSLYGTYAPSAPTKFGGGIYGSYSLNDYASAGVGLDYLGQFWMPSGTASLKYPIRPLSSIGLTNFSVTPFGIAGVATPLGGAGQNNGQLAELYGGGIATHIGRVGAVDIGAAYAYVQWSDAGAYSGAHYEGFLTFSFAKPQ